MDQQYAKIPVGTLPNHKFVKHSAQEEEFESLTRTGSDNIYYVIECFFDDYISLAIPTSQEQLRHVENAFIKGIHGIFLADMDDKEYSILLKKLKNRRHNGTWKMKCCIFSFMSSKRQSGCRPRNETPYCSRYPSRFELQTGDNNRMSLAPSTSKNFSQSLQNFSMLTFVSYRQMYCLAWSIKFSLLIQSWCSSTKIQNS